MEATERFQQYKVKNEEAANLLTLKIKELEAEKLDAIQNLDRYKAEIQEQEETNQSAKEDTSNIYKIKIDELEKEKLETAANILKYQEKIKELEEAQLQTYRQFLALVSGAAAVFAAAAAWSFA